MFCANYSDLGANLKDLFYFWRSFFLQTNAGKTFVIPDWQQERKNVESKTFEDNCCYSWLIAFFFPEHLTKLTQRTGVTPMILSDSMGTKYISILKLQRDDNVLTLLPKNVHKRLVNQSAPVASLSKCVVTSLWKCDLRKSCRSFGLPFPRLWAWTNRLSRDRK